MAERVSPGPKAEPRGPARAGDAGARSMKEDAVTGETFERDRVARRIGPCAGRPGCG